MCPATSETLRWVLGSERILRIVIISVSVACCRADHVFNLFGNVWTTIKLNLKAVFFFVLYQGIDMDRDWKLLLLFVQTDQLCACDQQQVANKICCLDSPLKI